MTTPPPTDPEAPLGRVAGRSDQADQGGLERGRAAYARRAWDEAFESLARADQAAALAPADLERLAWSAALTARDEEFLQALERLYHRHLDAGAGGGAARAAFWLGFRLLAVGEPGRASGWLARCQRLAEAAEQGCVEQGYLLLPRVHRHLGDRDWQTAHDVAAQAAEIGDRFAEADLIAFARQLQGRALLRQGRIDDGLTLIDEAMVAATGGELSPIITGLIYCSVIAGCRQVYALDRAREWTSALAGWCETQPQLVPFTGSCLVHRAEVMQLSGAWPDAIEEARRASARPSRPIDGHATADAFYQQAEIHRLRGELAAAEQDYRRASELGGEEQPGLALLRIIQGRPDAASSGIRRALGATTDPLQRVRFLPAYVEIMVAAADLDEARARCRELEEIGAAFDTDVLVALAAQARGVVQLAEGDAPAAMVSLRRALAVWQLVDAPYPVARLRVLVGRACRALGDQDGAALELDAARAVFERLGAEPDLRHLVALSSKTSAPGQVHGLTQRELEVLRLVAAGKTNKAIAKELFLSEKTVDRHVSNIFGKVNVASRAAATAFAYEHKLL